MVFYLSSNLPSNWRIENIFFVKKKKKSIKLQSIWNKIYESYLFKATNGKCWFGDIRGLSKGLPAKNKKYIVVSIK